MVLLDATYNFPNPEEADEYGLLAVGGDLSTGCLLKAYYSGIFPWFSESQPILWWSPNPRMVLFPEKLHVSKSMKQLFKREAFEVSFNQNFEEVIRNCANVNREDQDGTWITSEMIAGYIQLHKIGMAQSVEVWKDKELVGGLYGVYLKDKQVFCGESMFSKVSNASKYGFISLVKKLSKEHVKIIDCQVYSRHMESLGAEEIPRKEFCAFL